jgi:hypothetical protein
MEFIPEVNKNLVEETCVERDKEIPLPNTGDTMKIVATDWGFEVLRRSSDLRNEQTVIEVEVKSIKKAKLVLE